MGPNQAPKSTKDKPPKRGHADDTPSQPDTAPDPAKKPSKQRMNTTSKPLAPNPEYPSAKPHQQDPPASRQSANFDASGYATYPTSHTQRLHAGGLSGAELEYRELLDPIYRSLHPELNEPRHPSIVNQQRPLLRSPFDQNPTQAPPSQPDQYHMSSQPFQSPKNPSVSQPASGPPLAGDWRPEEDAELTRIKQEEKGVSFERVSRLMSVKPFIRSPKECKTRWSEIGGQRSSEAWTEEEDAELIQARVGHPSHTQGIWFDISKALKAKGFKRDHSSCGQRWQTVKPQTEPRQWSEAEDRELSSLTEAYTNKATSKYWEPISLAMQSQGFHVTVVDCRDRYYRLHVLGYK